MATNLILTGGPGHDFTSTTAAIVDLCESVGVASTIVEDPSVALKVLSEQPHTVDMMTVNALRWEMTQPRFRDLKQRWAYRPSPGELETLENFVRSGGALLACHAAPICFDGDASWRRCLGATWVWDASSHPVESSAQVTVTDVGATHPITSGFDSFTVIDEIYGFLDSDADIVVLATSAHGGSDHPVIWTRNVGDGRVVVDLLGHSRRSIDHPTHHELLRRSVHWLLPTFTTPNTIGV